MKNFRKNWLAPLLLLLLGLLNVLSGAFQLNSIAQGAPSTATTEMELLYFIRPIPIIAHIVAGCFFNLLAPLQFAPTLLKNRPQFHRWSGRLLVTAGITVGFSGLYMNHFFPAYGNFLKYPGIFVNSVGIIFALGYALWLVRQRQFKKHQVWMMRAVAFGLGPATQRVIMIPAFLILGEISDAMIGAVIWIGFIVNLLVVEWRLSHKRRQLPSKLNTQVR